MSYLKNPSKEIKHSRPPYVCHVCGESITEDMVEHFGHVQYPLQELWKIVATVTSNEPIDTHTSTTRSEQSVSTLGVVVLHRKCAAVLGMRLLHDVAKGGSLYPFRK